MKVDKANTIYTFCISMIAWCCTQVPPIPFTLENPSRSLIWELPTMKEVMVKFGLILLHTHMCMHGSQRKKESGLLTNRGDIFSRMVLRCDDNHTHKKWGPSQDPVTGKWHFATGEGPQSIERRNPTSTGEIEGQSPGRTTKQTIDIHVLRT